MAVDLSEEILLLGGFVLEVVQTLIFALLDDIVVGEEAVVVVVCFG